MLRDPWEAPSWGVNLGRGVHLFDPSHGERVLRKPHSLAQNTLCRRENLGFPPFLAHTGHGEGCGQAGQSRHVVRAETPGLQQRWSHRGSKLGVSSPNLQLTTACLFVCLPS